MTYKLIDGVERNKTHPLTFEIPDESELAKVQIGSLVKLGFEEAKEGDPAVERMWVKITTVKDEYFEGILDNIPRHIEIKMGEKVRFHKKT